MSDSGGLKESSPLMAAPLLEGNSITEKKKFPEPLSLEWRIWHSISYLIGGVTFVIGSVCYYPQYAYYVLGGWMFTIGSTGFLVADLNEWWKNNRVGCVFDDEYVEDYEEKVGKYFGPKDTVTGSYLRKENGINFGLSATGSTLYLIGSIMFIPSTNLLTLGTEVFIIGSAVIFLAQSWKVYRQGLSDPDNPSSRKFKFSNYSWDLPALGVDSMAGLGGLLYLIGSVYFLPSIDTSDGMTIIAANCFVAGGTSFLLSGIFILYRYFCTLNYAH